jgi:hypothetical protein
MLLRKRSWKLFSWRKKSTPYRGKPSKIFWAPLSLPSILHMEVTERLERFVV